MTGAIDAIPLPPNGTCPHNWTRSGLVLSAQWERPLIRHQSPSGCCFTTRVLLTVILFCLQILRQRFVNLVFCKRSIAWVVREKLQVLSRPSILIEAVVMSSSLGSAAPKKDGALIRPATDRVKGGDPPAFLTEEARLRLEEGLRDAGLRAALLVLGQSPPFPQRPSQTPPQSSQRRSGPAQRPGEAFLTEEALVRLEDGLRAQREQQEGRRSSRTLTR
jgi:hypothetical protein